MLITLNFQIKDKAWQRADVSSVLSNVFCWFAALLGPFFKNKLICEPTKQKMRLWRQTTAPKFGV